MPGEVLEDTDITPEYLSKDPTAALFTSKVANVKDQIKRALFRHCLFKIQNVEVQTLQKECEEKSRWLDEIRHLSDADTNWVTWAATKKFTRRNKEPFSILRKERWTIRRCGSPVPYDVIYFREGGDGFSTRVIPVRWMDRLRGVYFYYFEICPDVLDSRRAGRELPRVAVDDSDDFFEKYASYEDYLDAQVTEKDTFYLGGADLARQLVELGCRRGEVLSREEFNEKRRVAEREKRRRLQSMVKVLASADKDLTAFPTLRHLAAREEMARSGKIVSIIFIRDRNAKGQEISGYIDYGHRMKTENFEAYFSREKRILPRPTDLCFYNWETPAMWDIGSQSSSAELPAGTANESPNFQVVPDTKMGLLFRNKRDRKMIDVNPKHDPGDNSKRHDVTTSEYLQVVIFDHMPRRKA
ncbi:hypothetical protein FOZ60_016816 [Perkinsus olseni]|uniref:Cilia- and flagella-associated protein 299 n=1 Tax=Perkinsus olseni TaxID=32597 RepID=A0A7J6P3V8_PEROL|nr:hypothetical protein FOZ60_016816 [Perkinsus olseni]